MTVRTSADCTCDTPKMFEIIQFKGSTGWLNQFWGSNGIIHKTISGEKVDASKYVAKIRKQEQLKGILEQYPAKDIYNGDQMAFFYNVQ
jgi:hypothetical protein